MAGDSAQDYYVVLGVDESATQDEIKAAYRALAQRYHPDKNPGSSSASRRFKTITEAYAVLSDPTKRAGYNFDLGVYPNKPSAPPPPAGLNAQAASNGRGKGAPGVPPQAPGNSKATAAPTPATPPAAKGKRGMVAALLSPVFGLWRAVTGAALEVLLWPIFALLIFIVGTTVLIGCGLPTDSGAGAEAVDMTSWFVLLGAPVIYWVFYRPISRLFRSADNGRVRGARAIARSVWRHQIILGTALMAMLVGGIWAVSNSRSITYTAADEKAGFLHAIHFGAGQGVLGLKPDDVVPSVQQPQSAGDGGLPVTWTNGPSSSPILRAYKPGRHTVFIQNGGGPGDNKLDTVNWHAATPFTTWFRVVSALPQNSTTSGAFSVTLQSIDGSSADVAAEAPNPGDPTITGKYLVRTVNCTSACSFTIDAQDVYYSIDVES